MDMSVKRVDNVLYGPKINIPIEERGLGRLIFDKMWEHKHKILQIDAKTGEEQTYGSIQKSFIRIALEMRQREIKENDVVLTCSGNNTVALLSIYSTLYLNAIPAALDPSLSVRDSAHLIKIVSPKMIFATEDGLGLVEKALTEWEIKPEIVVIGSHKTRATISEFLKTHPDEDTFVPDDVKDIRSTSNIFFSSGTTGLPKAVMHSHYSMMKAFHTMSYSHYLTLTGACLFFTSFYWISAILITTGIIIHGGSKLFVEAFTPESYLEYVERYKVRSSFLSPTYAFEFTEENTKKYNTESLREMLVGGSVLSENHVLSFRKFFPKTAIRTGYGQTELGGFATTFWNNNEALGKAKPTSCGVPFLNIIVKISDLDTEKTLGPYEKGEIRVISDTAFRGYLASSENAAESSFDHEGFVRTGDVGYYDEDNCFYFSDRIKEMFKYRSWHVVPASIESIIYDHPAVLEAIVVGVPQEMDDHHPLGLVIVREGYDITEAELLNYVNEKVTDREKLRAGLKFVNKFPKTPTGKLWRLKIRDIAKSGNLQQLIT